MNVARNTELFQMKFGGMDICGVEDADVFKFHVTDIPGSNSSFATLLFLRIIIISKTDI